MRNHLHLSASLLAALLLLGCPGAPPEEDPDGTPVADAGEQTDAGETDAGSGPTRLLTVTPAGPGAGSISSSPAGIVDCTTEGGTCTASFPEGTVVTLTQSSLRGDFFAGWSGSGCAGVAGCALTLSEDATVKATFMAAHFVSYRPLPDGGQGTNFWGIHGDGTGAWPITQRVGGSVYSPSIAPGGERAVYLSNQPLDGGEGFFNQNVWMASIDGVEHRPVTTYEVAYPEDVRFTPDGRIVYSVRAALDGGDQSGPRNFRIVEADGSSRWLSTFDDNGNTGYGFGVSSQAVFTRRYDLFSNVFQVPFDGGAPTNLTNFLTGSLGAEMVPSPDGTRVAFLSNHGFDPAVPTTVGAYNLWLGHADGTGVAPVTQFVENGVGSGFDWLDNGRLVFSTASNPDGGTALARQNVMIVDVVTGQISQLTNLTVPSGDWPRAAPDQRHVLYSSPRALDGGDAYGDYTQLWRVTDDGQGDQPITTDPAYGAYDPRDQD